MNIFKDNHDFFFFTSPPLPLLPEKKDYSIGWCREGKTNENNNVYVVFKLNINGSAGKQSGLEG
jgi:hypothetical protein